MSLARLVVTAVRIQGRSQSEVARDYQLSRRWVHELVKRYDAEGEAGLQARSRRPHTSPQRIPQALADEIVQLRKSLADQGLDAGAHTIAYHLQQRHGHSPAPSTIWRVLSGRGFVTPSRKSGPAAPTCGSKPTCPTSAGRPTSPTGPSGTAAGWRSSTSSTTTPASCWFLLASHARSVTKAADVVASFHQAAKAHGFPASMLTDNGAVFTATPRGGRCAIELELARLGIAYRHSRAYHPQTCGKVERFHQTLKRWLVKQPAAQTVAQLQTQLDRFTGYYNHQRPHRALGRRTPAAAFWARPKATPSLPGLTIPRHYRVRHDKVTTGSTAPASSPCATTAGCTTSDWAAATPAPTSSSWSPIWTSACSPRTASRSAR
jgi:transposase